MQKEKVVCLISLLSKNKESYMFHVPNVALTSMQAEAIGLPLVSVETEGEKENELDDLQRAIRKAVEDHKIEGIVTGAVGSVYQAARIQKICDELDLFCFNPLWQMNQVALLHELLEGFDVMISGVFAEPFDERWLGRKLDNACVEELVVLAKTHRINPAGEGGEIETTVLDAPFFKRRIAMKEAHAEYNNHAGTFHIDSAVLKEK